MPAPTTLEALLAQPDPEPCALMRASPLPRLHPRKTAGPSTSLTAATEFVVALNEGGGAGTRVETWPPEVRIFIDQHVSRWVEDNKEERALVRVNDLSAAPNTTASNRVSSSAS